MKNFYERLKGYNEYLERKYKIKIGISNLLYYIVEYVFQEGTIDLLEKFIVVNRITELKQKRIERLKKNLEELEKQAVK